MRDHELFVRDGFDIHVMARDGPRTATRTTHTHSPHSPLRRSYDTSPQELPLTLPLTHARPLTQVRLTLAEAVLGGRVVVPTLEGQAAPQLPPGAVHPLSRTRP